MEMTLRTLTKQYFSKKVSDVSVLNVCFSILDQLAIDIGQELFEIFSTIIDSRPCYVIGIISPEAKKKIEASGMTVKDTDVQVNDVTFFLVIYFLVDTNLEVDMSLELLEAGVYQGHDYIRTTIARIDNNRKYDEYLYTSIKKEIIDWKNKALKNAIIKYDQKVNLLENFEIL
jgi:hypothetical protein